MIISLAWRNIWRQPIRTWLSIMGMALSATLLVFAMSFQLGTYDTMKIGALSLLDGFGQFQMEEYVDDPDVSHSFDSGDAIMAAVANVDGITAVAPRASSFAILANGDRSFAAAVFGVDPAREVNISTLYSTIEQGRYLQADDDNTIVMGLALARNLGLELGDMVTMLGTGANGSVAADVLELVGIYDTGVPMLDRQITQMPLVRFSETYLMDGAVNSIAVKGDRLGDVLNAEEELRSIASQTGTTYRNWKELQPGMKQMIDLDMTTAGLTYLIMVVLVVFIILNTLYMSVLERTREFGGLMALGMRPKLLGRMVWMELVFLSLLGNGLGIAIGSGITLILQHYGLVIPGMDELFAQWNIPSRIYPALSALTMFAGPFVVVASIALLGIIPYRHILRLEPVTAMSGA